MSSKFPCTLGENDYRTVVVAYHDGVYDPPLELHYAHRKYFINTGVFRDEIDDVFEDMLLTMRSSYRYNNRTSVSFMMTSPTNEEREIIMRVWNEWQDEHKESENEQ